MGNFFTSSTIYKTFFPFSILLCFCGFWYNGIITERKHNASREAIKALLSVLHFLLFVALFVMNVLWGEREPESTESLLLKHGWHKLYLIEFLFLPIIMWSNFYHRTKLDECLRLIEHYDTVCQVKRW